MSDELEQLRAVVEAMTPGPWGADETRSGEYQIRSPDGTIGECGGWDDDTIPTDRSNARGIAALRNLAPALLDVVEAVDFPTVALLMNLCHGLGCGACIGCKNRALRDKIREELGE